MSQKDDEDNSLFIAEFASIKLLTQSTIKLPYKNVKKKQFIESERLHSIESHYFSDEFQPILPDEGPMCYIRADVNKELIKQLRRGDFLPDITLDLHGLNKEATKKELGEFILYCKKNRFYCCLVVHGIGHNVLKKHVPLWLAQHSDILAFHQATSTYGGQGALFVLVELEDFQMKS